MLPLSFLFSRPPAKLLDLGVGTGWTSAFYARRGYDVTGQDIAPDMIYQANRNKERYGVENLVFITSDYEQMDFENAFDCAVFYDSLHHSVDEVAALQMVYRTLRPGGMCVTLEPGVGHAAAEHSRLAIQEFGVTERDMPPALIMKSGRQAGFHDFNVYKRPPAAPPLVVSEGNGPNMQDGLKRSVLRVRKWGGVCYRALRGVKYGGNPALLESGIVTMRK